MKTRPIKFRGMRADGGGMVYGDHFDTSKSGHCDYLPTIIENGGADPSDFYLIDPSTLGQYTGLTDKNGKDIYEGDIVTKTSNQPFSPFGDSFTGTVVFDECFFYLDNGKEGHALFDEISEIEVIGTKNN